jgi:hypothetical protein
MTSLGAEMAQMKILLNLARHAASAISDEDAGGQRK